MLIKFDPASKDRRMHISIYHYRLAKLYDQKGLKDQGKAEYGVFLHLWKDADAGLPGLIDARQRLVER
jgi:hypothetical protein